MSTDIGPLRAKQAEFAQLERQAIELANFCKGMSGEAMNLSVKVDSTMGDFFPAHEGVTPANLKSNYRSWEGDLPEASQKLTSVENQCRAKAAEWHREQERLEGEIQQAIRDNEREEEEKKKAATSGAS